MAEQLLDVSHLDKRAAYAELRAQLAAVLAGVDDEVAIMSTVASVLHHAFGFLWTGFYRCVSPTLLRVGPYQGTLGCLEIAFGKGVCGTAAAERKSVCVPDVHAFPGHITCDARSRSELVVPVFNKGGALIAVLDIDSDREACFDDVDVAEVEAIVASCFAR